MCKDEIMDEELTGMVNYTDETVPAEMPCMDRKPEGKEKPAAVDAEHASFPVRKRGTMDRVKGCATWGLICGGISMLMGWSYVNDLMAMQAAYPCIVACGILGGFGVGKNAVK